MPNPVINQILNEDTLYDIEDLNAVHSSTGLVESDIIADGAITTNKLSEELQGAEAARDLAQAKNNADQALNNEAALGVTYEILSEEEYDEDGTPIIEAVPGKVYCVPSQSSLDSDDEYVEWIWLGNRFEKLGTSMATINPVTTDNIDAIFEESNPTGTNILELTGLNYFWAKLKNWATNVFAAIAHTHSGEDITDGTITSAKLDSSLQDSISQIGMVQMFAGSTPPDRWLLCNGAAVSRTTYSRLFSIIGVTYGAGNGSTTFNVPDLSGKFALGKSSAYSVGSTGGETTHTLSVAELPSHTHTVTSSGSGTSGAANYTTAATVTGGSCTASNNTAVASGGASYSTNPTVTGGACTATSAGAHYHNTLFKNTAGSGKASLPDPIGVASTKWAGQYTETSGAHTHPVPAHTHTFSAGAHTHTVTAHTHPVPAHTHTFNAGAHTHTTPNHTHTINNTGSGTAHNNMPPYIALNYIIYAGV